jgi:hypothetical protein
MRAPNCSTSVTITRRACPRAIVHAEPSLSVEPSSISRMRLVSGQRAHPTTRQRFAGGAVIHYAGNEINFCSGALCQALKKFDADPRPRQSAAVHFKAAFSF